MLKILLLLITMISFLVGTILWAQEQWIDMEWAAVEGASSYELQVYLVENGKRLPRGSYRVDSPAWSEKMDPGVYEFRVRTIDDRQIPGDWSAYGKFILHLEKPQLQRPLEKETIIASSSIEDVSFQWNSVYKATEYLLEIWDSEGNTIYKKQVSDTAQIVPLKIAKNYYWRVVALNDSDNVVPNREAEGQSKENKESKGRPFSIKGGILNVPSIEIDFKDKKVMLSWSLPPRASQFSYQLFSGKDDSGKRLMRKDNTTQRAIFIPANKLQVGDYRFSVWAYSDQLEESPPNHLNFSWNGSSLSNIEQHSEQFLSSEENSSRVFGSKKRNQALFVNWEMLNQKYNGVVGDTGTYPYAELSSLRLSLDYYTINPSSFFNWSFHYEKESYQYSNSNWDVWMIKADFLKNISLSETWGLRLNGGLFVRSQQYINSGKMQGDISQDNIGTMGPETGLQISKRFGANWTFAFGPNLYLHTFKTKTPSGGNIKTTNSFVVAADLTYSYDPFLQVRVGVSHQAFRNEFQGKGGLYATGENNESRVEGDAIKVGIGFHF